MVTDPIADMLNRVSNASKVGKPAVVVPFSKVTFAVASVLKDEGYLANVGKKSKFNRQFLSLDIAYLPSGEPVLKKVARVSKPSRRVYEKASMVHSVRQGKGLSVISTSKGVMTDKKAREAKVGGEIICRLW